MRRRITRPAIFQRRRSPHEATIRSNKTHARAFIGIFIVLASVPPLYYLNSDRLFSETPTVTLGLSGRCDDNFLPRVNLTRTDARGVRLANESVLIAVQFTPTITNDTQQCSELSISTNLHVTKAGYYVRSTDPSSSPPNPRFAIDPYDSWIVTPLSVPPAHDLDLTTLSFSPKTHPSFAGVIEFELRGAVDDGRWAEERLQLTATLTDALAATNNSPLEITYAAPPNNRLDVGRGLPAPSNSIPGRLNSALYEFHLGPSMLRGPDPTARWYSLLAITVDATRERILNTVTFLLTTTLAIGMTIMFEDISRMRG
jgi:hypothetical protein